MKKIPLTQGKFTIVDDEDYEWLNQWKWYYHGGYADRGTYENKKVKTVKMHRLINKTPVDMITDHVNGDKLDNRRINLRDATRAENMMNSKSNKNSTSRFKGVHWNKDKKKWHVQIQSQRKQYNKGYFDCEFDAAKCYDVHAVSYFGVFAKTNFPSVL